MNQLQFSKSLYLQQHASNPVHWNPWSHDILDFAKKNNKPIIVSIGYSACHWCHVMENESFTDSEIAEWMNLHFVCIKVDREEHPDVDSFFIEAVQIISGSAGWPLNCFLTPDGKPFYGGTYFKKWDWLKTLQRITEIFKYQNIKLLEQADQLFNHLVTSNLNFFFLSPNSLTNFNLLYCIKKVTNEIDIEFGGFRGTPKFILPGVWIFLLEFQQYNYQDDLDFLIHKSLTQIACGGINDHIGGGFSRYSVDTFWKIPHFEKMLYDNAQLLSLYSVAFLYSKKKFYKQVAISIYFFLVNELKSQSGGFIASVDADNSDGEGNYYAWTIREIKNTLNTDYKLFCKYFNISEKGNFDGKNILCLNPEMLIVESDKYYETFQNSKQILLHKRNERPKPATDTKIICSWNSLLINGLIDYYKISGQKLILREARILLDYLLSNFVDEEYKVWRIVYDEKSRIDGIFEDYAFLIQAILAYYSCEPDHYWIELANMLVITCNKNFKSEDGLYYNSINNDLLFYKIETTDQVIPSANAFMAINLFKLGLIGSENQYLEMAQKMAQKLTNVVCSAPLYHFMWLRLFNYLENGIFELRANIVQNSWIKKVQINFPTDICIINDSNLESEQAILCYKKTCSMPLYSNSELLHYINNWLH